MSQDASMALDSGEHPRPHDHSAESMDGDSDAVSTFEAWAQDFVEQDPATSSWYTSSQLAIADVQAIPEMAADLKTPAQDPAPSTSPSLPSVPSQEPAREPEPKLDDLNFLASPEAGASLDARLYINDNGRVASIENLQFSKIAAKAPTLAACFTCRRVVPIELSDWHEVYESTIYGETIPLIALLRGIYLDDYTFCEALLDRPVSLLLHLQVLHLTRTFGATSLENCAIMHIERELDAAQRQVSIAPDFCQAVRYMYAEMRNEPGLRERLARYCVQNFGAHLHAEGEALRQTVYESPQFHADLLHANVADNFCSVYAQLIMQLPVCGHRVHGAYGGSQDFVCEFHSPHIMGPEPGAVQALTQARPQDAADEEAERGARSEWEMVLSHRQRAASKSGYSLLERQPTPTASTARSQRPLATAKTEDYSDSEWETAHSERSRHGPSAQSRPYSPAPSSWTHVSTDVSRAPSRSSRTPADDVSSESEWSMLGSRAATPAESGDEGLDADDGAGEQVEIRLGDDVRNALAGDGSYMTDAEVTAWIQAELAQHRRRRP